MHIRDRVYGEHTITEPVVLELLNSPTLERLKSIDQAGYFEPYFPGFSHSRFEHSVGVFLLLRRYAAPLEEQLAGLLHDISHTAFSHCVDYVLEAGSGERQDLQDNVFAEYLLRSEIPAILARHGFAVDRIVNDENFPLKERTLPTLCADRIDYSLRSARVRNDHSTHDIADILAHLDVRNGDWVFRDRAHARIFGELFRHVNTKYFAGIESAVMFRTVSDYLRHAIEHAYITEADLFSTDQAVLTKIARYHRSDPLLQHLFARMNNQIPYQNDPTSTVQKIVCKARIVDPLFFDGEAVRALSDADPAWSAIVQEESHPKEYRVRFDDEDAATLRGQ